MKTIKSCAGYSLIELLTALAVMAGILAATVPSMVDMMGAIRARSASEMLLNALILARTSAVQLNTRVTVCKSANGVRCTDGEGWHIGWLVFQDANSNGQLEEGEVIISRQSALAGKLRASGNGPVNAYVSYTPFGQAKLLSGAFQAGTITICRTDGSGATSYVVVVASSGRAKMVKATEKGCN